VNVDVRRLTPAEVERLQAAMPSWHAHEYADRAAYQSRGLAVQLVAWSDGEPVGRGMLVLPGHPEWSPSAFRETCPEIRDLAVLPAAQRRGVGSALIAALEREAIEAGFDRMGLMVGLDEDYTAARAVYERRGYRFAHGPFISSARLATDDGVGLAVGGACEYRVKSL
jgi:GNAT superfamily N-acetyltransferase